MKRITFLLITAITILISSCAEKDKIVQIDTDFGAIKIKLYKETPLHQKNFLKLVKQGFYDDLIFHRVINNFMIQGGDPNSREAKEGVRLGSGGPGYTVPAEINQQFFHKKGALAAARMPDSVNPKKESSGSQFYIVQGKIFTKAEIENMQKQKNASRSKSIFQKLYKENKQEFEQLRKAGKQDEMNIRVSELREQAEEEAKLQSEYVFSEEQIKAYTTVGGYPSLDNEYTVFGEVIEGLDIIDKIAAVETDRYDRPLKDVKFKIEVAK